MSKSYEDYLDEPGYDDSPETQEEIVIRLNALVAGPAERELSEDERKLASFILGVNVALVQFIVEGVIPVKEQQHFMIHLQDAVARLYNNDEVLVDGAPLDISVDSKAGEFAITAFASAIKNGKIEHKKQEVKQASEYGQYNWGAPAPLDKKRTLN